MRAFKKSSSRPALTLGAGRYCETGVDSVAHWHWHCARRWVNRHGPGQTMLQEAAREKMLPEQRDVKCAQKVKCEP